MQRPVWIVILDCASTKYQRKIEDWLHITSSPSDLKVKLIYRYIDIYINPIAYDGFIRRSLRRAFVLYILFENQFTFLYIFINIWERPYSYKQLQDRLLCFLWTFFGKFQLSFIAMTTFWKKYLIYEKLITLLTLSSVSRYCMFFISTCIPCYSP